MSPTRVFLGGDEGVTESHTVVMSKLIPRLHGTHNHSTPTHRFQLILNLLVTHFCTAVRVALVRSISPPAGLSTRPRTPFPVPFMNPHTPPFFAPADGDKISSS